MDHQEAEVRRLLRQRYAGIALNKRRSRRRSPEERQASEAWAFGGGPQIAIASETEVVGPGLVFARHHLVPRGVCRRFGAGEWDLRNKVVMTETRHRRHHNGREPLRWSELSAERQESLRAFATEFGLTAWLARHLQGYEA